MLEKKKENHFDPIYPRLFFDGRKSFPVSLCESLLYSLPYYGRPAQSATEKYTQTHTHSRAGGIYMYISTLVDDGGFATLLFLIFFFFPRHNIQVPALLCWVRRGCYFIFFFNRPVRQFPYGWKSLDTDGYRGIETMGCIIVFFF